MGRVSATSHVPGACLRCPPVAEQAQSLVSGAWVAPDRDYSRGGEHGAPVCHPEWWRVGAKDPLLTHEPRSVGGGSFAPNPPPAQDDSEDEIVVGPPAGKNHRTYGNPRVRLRVPGAFRIDAAGSTISSIGSAFTTPVIPAIT